MFVIFIKRKILIYSTFLLLLLLLLYGITQIFLNPNVPTLSPIYIGDTSEKAVALMINVDWGEDVLPQMLNVLKEKDVQATFFITGRFAKGFPQLVQQIAAHGHEIGNHGYSHPHADKLSIEANQKELTDSEKVFQGLNIEVKKIFAPPYGEHKAHVVSAADALGYKTIMWTVDTVDWKNPSPDVLINRVIKKADNGALILMHPKECTLEALPVLIDQLKQNEFSFKTVMEILK